MAFQIIRENIEVESIAGEGAVQALIEGSVILPGPTRDAAALFADARLEMGNIEVQADRVATDGQVYFTLLYTSADEGGVRSVETAMNFSHILEVPGAGPKMGIEVRGTVEHVEADIVGGKATLRAIANLRAQASAKQTIACVGEIQGVSQLQTLVTHPQSLCTIAQGENKLMLDDRFELPYGLESEEVLITQTRAVIERTAAMEGRVELFGQVQLDAYHRTSMFDRPIARTRHAVPFNASVELPGCKISSPVQASAEVRDLAAQLQIEDEEKFLYCEMTLLIRAKAQELNEAAVISDAYTASDELLELTSSAIPMRTEYREENGIDAIKAVLALDNGQPPMNAVLATFVRPAMWELSTDTRSHAEGVLETTVLYTTVGTERPVALTEEVPFSATFDFALPSSAMASLTVEDAEAIQISGDRLELKCNVRLCGNAYSTCDYNVALDAELNEEGHAIPGGITLYFAQPGDTLWSVAKQFRTTRESLTRFNPDIEELSGTEKILLYKRTVNV